MGIIIIHGREITSRRTIAVSWKTKDPLNINFSPFRPHLYALSSRSFRIRVLIRRWAWDAKARVSSVLRACELK